MNIYLDIDGVLLANETNAAAGADELIRRVLEVYPDSVYWLTTHDWQGQNTVHKVLDPVLKPETVALLDRIKSTDWKEAKTDGIDFSKKFLWIDDDLWPEELAILEDNDATDNFILVDLSKDPDQLKKIAELI